VARSELIPQEESPHTVKAQTAGQVISYAKSDPSRPVAGGSGRGVAEGRGTAQTRWRLSAIPDASGPERLVQKDAERAQGKTQDAAQTSMRTQPATRGRFHSLQASEAKGVAVEPDGVRLLKKRPR
jgi:hypothetical protein